MELVDVADVVVFAVPVAVPVLVALVVPVPVPVVPVGSAPVELSVVEDEGNTVGGNSVADPQAYMIY